MGCIYVISIIFKKEQSLNLVALLNKGEEMKLCGWRWGSSGSFVIQSNLVQTHRATQCPESLLALTDGRALFLPEGQLAQLTAHARTYCFCKRTLAADGEDFAAEIINCAYQPLGSESATLQALCTVVGKQGFLCEILGVGATRCRPCENELQTLALMHGNNPHCAYTPCA